MTTEQTDGNPLNLSKWQIDLLEKSGNLIPFVPYRKQKVEDAAGDTVGI